MHIFQSELTNHWLEDFVFIISIIRPELFECKQITKATNFGVTPNINRLTSAPVVTSQLFRCLSSVSHLLGCCLYFDGTLVKFQLKDSCLQAKQDPLNLLSLIEMPLRKPPKTLLNLSIDALVKHLSSYITRWALLATPFWCCSLAIKLFPPRKIGKNSLLFDFTESSQVFLSR